MPLTDIKPIVDHVLSKCPFTECGYRPDYSFTNIVCYGCIHYKDGDYPMLTSSKESAQTEKLRYIGDKEHDRYTGGSIDCRKGDIILVSKAEKHQKLTDHGTWFEEVGVEAKVAPPPIKKAAKKKAKKAIIGKVTEYLPDENVSKISWKDLKEAAAKLGIKTFGRKRAEIEEEFIAKRKK